MRTPLQTQRVLLTGVSERVQQAMRMLNPLQYKTSLVNADEFIVKDSEDNETHKTVTASVLSSMLGSGGGNYWSRTDGYVTPTSVGDNIRITTGGQLQFLGTDIYIGVDTGELVFTDQNVGSITLGSLGAFTVTGTDISPTIAGNDLLFNSGEIVKFENSQVSIYRSGSDLVLKDVNAGIKTLSELAFGLVSIQGTPEANQITVWYDEDTVQGLSDLWYDGSSLAVNGSITSTYGTLQVYQKGNTISDGFFLYSGVGNSFRIFHDSSNNVNFARATSSFMTLDPSGNFIMLGGEVRFNDSTTAIWEDISNNLSFKDANAGTVTLSQLAAVPWTKTGTNLSPTTAGDDVLLNSGEIIKFENTFVYIDRSGSDLRFTDINTGTRLLKELYYWKEHTTNGFITPSTDDNHLYLSNTKKLAWGTDEDTYIYENAANELEVYNAGTLTLKIADGQITSSESIVPSADSTYNLGSGEAWANLYVDTINIPNSTFQIWSTGSDMMFKDETAGSVSLSDLATSGEVDIYGTPVANEIAVWQAEDTIEGDANFTWDGSILTVTGDITTDTLSIVNQIDEISTDGTLADDSDSAIPTEKAVKTYVDTYVAATHHHSLLGLDDDDHEQYHNDTRGDIRYYTKTLLNEGQLDDRYYTETEIQTSGQSSIHWDNITNEPTTLAGYGISDTKANFDTALSNGNFAFADGTGSSTELAVWSDASIIYGDANLTWDGTLFSVGPTNTVYTQLLGASGVRIRFDNMTGGWSRGLHAYSGATSYMSFGHYGTNNDTLNWSYIGKTYTDNIARFYPDGQAELYYDNNIKFETLSTGAKVTGALTVTGTVTMPTPFTLGAVSVTATGTNLNILAGATLTTAELNYVTGTTSNIQTQLNAKSAIASPTFTGTVTIPSLIITDLTDGYIPYRKAADDKLSNSNIYYDGTKIGISTATPAEKLHVKSEVGANIVTVVESGHASSSYLTLADQSTTNVYKVRVGSVGDDLSLYAGGSERIRVSSAGNVGIASSPNYRVTVGAGASHEYLQIYTGTAHIGGIYFSDGTTTNPGGIFYDHSANDLAFRANTVDDILVINSTGLVITGTTDISSSLTVNTINEHTGATGITIDGVLIKDNGITVGGTWGPTTDYHVATKLYVDTAVTGGTTYMGGYNATTNTPDLDTSPSGVSLGDMYAVTVAGDFFTTAVAVGTWLIANTAGADAEAEWDIVATAAGTFLSLTDTPSDYTDDASKFVRVNSTPNGLEFVAASSIALSGFSNDLSSLTVGNGLQLNSGTTYNGSAAKTISVDYNTTNLKITGVELDTIQSIATAATPTFSAIDITNNITVGGTVDGVDIAALKTDVDGFPDELKNLVTAEIQQLENIGAVTISADQWAILGDLSVTLTATELNYVDGVTSAIQTQLNAKEATLTKGDLTELTSGVLTIGGGVNSVIGAGTTITVNTDSPSDGDSAHLCTADQIFNWVTGLGYKTGTVTSVASGNGMNFSTITTTGTVTMGTPSNITISSTNSVTSTSHTHALSLTYDDLGAAAEVHTHTLASSTFANQGTTTTVLHGNASGNPSWGAIVTNDITDDVITYAKIQNVVNDDRILGNISGANSIIEELTGTHVTSLLTQFSTSSTTQGVVPGSNSTGATYYLDGSGNWSVPGGEYELPATVVKTDQSNTYTAGMKQIMPGSATYAGLNIAYAGNPSTLSAGDMWYDSSGARLYYRDGVSTMEVVAKTATQTLTYKTINANDNTITTNSTATGDLLKSNGTKFEKLARGTSGQVLKSTAGDIAWGSVDYTEVTNKPTLVDVTGTPLDNQLAIWTDANTIEGDASLTFVSPVFQNSGTGIRKIIVESSNNHSYFDVKCSSASGAFLDLYKGGSRIWHTGIKEGSGSNYYQFIKEGEETPRIWIDYSNTRVGINKNSPSYTLHVGGTIYADSTITGTTITGTTIVGANVTSGANPGHTHTGSSISALDTGDITTGTFSVSRGGTGASTFTSNAVLTGNGTSAIQAESNLTFNASTNVLTVTGTVTSTGNITATDFALSSDIKWKKNIRSFRDLDLALQLNPVLFNWKDDRNIYDNIGFIAQEVELIRPDLIVTNESGDKYISYSKITAINNAAIHELYKEIQQLKEEIKKLNDGNSR